jgi:hypothetical protein
VGKVSRRLVAVAIVVALGGAALVWAVTRAPERRAPLPAPVAAGTSAGNLTLDGSSKWVLMRWVARQTGTLAALHLRIEAEGSACDHRRGHTGYGLGNGGNWHVTTHPVLADGRPDIGTTLATQEFRPCAGPLVPDVLQEIVRIEQGIAVRRGQEYATVIRNTDPDPARNFTSTNFLYTSTGILGANGRNERSPDAPDSYYGLDPRELVGYSTDGGRSWALPGGQYGAPGGRSFLPTYVQQYADGTVAGQPYYYTAAASTAPRTMVFRNIGHAWTISALGAYSASAGSGTLTLTVDGERRAQRSVTGPGMMRAEITPVTVRPGQTVKVTASGLSIQNVVADTAWGRLMGMHLLTSPWFVQDEPNFTHAAPVYALPAYGADVTSSTPPVTTPLSPPTPGSHDHRPGRRPGRFRQAGHLRHHKHARHHKHPRRHRHKRHPRRHHRAGGQRHARPDGRRRAARVAVGNEPVRDERRDHPGHRSPRSNRARVHPRRSGLRDSGVPSGRYVVNSARHDSAEPTHSGVPRRPHGKTARLAQGRRAPATSQARTAPKA